MTFLRRMLALLLRQVAMFLLGERYLLKLDTLEARDDGHPSPQRLGPYREPAATTLGPYREPATPEDDGEVLFDWTKQCAVCAYAYPDCIDGTIVTEVCRPAERAVLTAPTRFCAIPGTHFHRRCTKCTAHWLSKLPKGTSPVPRRPAATSGTRQME